MAIPKFDRTHVLKAMSAIDQGIKSGFRDSTRYDLVHEGRKYPPKAVVGLAAQIATGHELLPSEFSGGEAAANSRLRKLGFAVTLKPGLDLERGRLYARSDLHKVYGGLRQKGISLTSGQVILLFSSQTSQQHGYADGWDENGVFLYTGEGPSGDMKFTAANRAIRDHIAGGKVLELFQSLGKGKGCRYVGQFACPSWEYRPGVGLDGKSRQAIVFHLVEIKPEDEHQPSSEPTMPIESLKQAAYAAASEVSQKKSAEARKTYYERSHAVRNYVLARAAGICEACRQPAPFARTDGTPYLEPHHIHRVSDGGPDHPQWVGGVCPNCHREVHFGANGTAINQQLLAYIKSIEQPAK